MSKITSFNNGNVSDLRVELNNALKELKDKFGLDINLGRITYDSDHFTCKMTVTKEGGKENQIRKATKGEITIGSRFKDSTGCIYTVVDFVPRSYKYPYIGMNSRGQKYKFTKMAVLNNLVK